jgi:hypothetical protein
MPCPDQTTIDPSPNRRPLGRQLCLPISPTSRKTQAPSCSRLLTRPRPPIRLRARCLLRPNPKLRGTRVPRQKSPAPGLDECHIAIIESRVPGARYRELCGTLPRDGRPISRVSGRFAIARVDAESPWRPVFFGSGRSSIRDGVHDKERGSAPDDECRSQPKDVPRSRAHGLTIRPDDDALATWRAGLVHDGLMVAQSAEGARRRNALRPPTC